MEICCCIIRVSFSGHFLLLDEKWKELEYTMARARKKFIDRVRQVLIEISFEKGVRRGEVLGDLWAVFRIVSSRIHGKVFLWT
jgi:hypothetical protein